MTATLHIATGVASAALTPAQKCEIAKNKAVAKKEACLTAEHDKTIAGKPSDATKCTDAFSTAFAKAEAAAARAGGSCPTTSDVAAIEQRVDTATNGIGAALSGVHFVDNGDGTVTDNLTGLQWEKKVAGASCLHCVIAAFTWSSNFISTAPDGTAFTGFLGNLNDCTSSDGTITGGFAGHCDWRLPTIAELQTILDRSQGACAGGSGPCIAPIFGPTANADYWSSTSRADLPEHALLANFHFGSVGSDLKANANFVRGVRAGL